jgi:hypothetical protein
LLGACPAAQPYRNSRRSYAGLTDLEYPFHDRTVTVTHCGRICIGRRKINLSQVFAEQNVGIKEVADKIWLVNFMHTIWVFLITRQVASNVPRTRSVPDCYPCLRKNNGYHAPR